MSRFSRLAPLLLLLFIPLIASADTDPPLQGGPVQRETFTDTHYLAWWDEMSRPPSVWVDLQQTIAAAEAEDDPQKRVEIATKALIQLEDYLASTDPAARMAANKVADTRTRINTLRDRGFSELRALKERERSGPKPATRHSLIELVQRVKSGNPPIPFTPQELAQLAGVAPFVSGPHVANFDTRYIESFGHYNPAFLKWAAQTISSLDAPSFEALSPIYLDSIAYHAQYLLGARYQLLTQPERVGELRQRYETALKGKRPFNPIAEIPYVEGSFDGQYLAYWLRREIDGTAEASQRLLELAIDRFQPGTLLTLKKEHRRTDRTALTVAGTYHADELDIVDGDHVFAFSSDKGRASLRADIAKVELVSDPIMDEEGKATGKTISLRDSHDDGVLILRGGFQAGSIDTVGIPPLRECLASCSLRLGSLLYDLTVRNIDEHPSETLEEQPSPSFLLELRQGATTKYLKNVREIVWAGDLDRDGKLDLIYDDRFHYNVGTSLHLLLSSGSPDALPVEVSHCLSVGC